MKTKAKYRFGALACGAAIATSTLSAHADATSTVTTSQWAQIGQGLNLSASYDALSHAWSTKDPGAKFGSTLMVIEAAILDNAVPGLGSAILEKVNNWMYPKDDPFMLATKTITDAIRTSEANVLSRLDQLWVDVHEDHANMINANFTAGMQSLEDFRALKKWQRVDTANRVKLNQIIEDLRVVKAWIESQSQAKDTIGNLHHYVVVVNLLKEALSEASTLDYLAPAYNMQHSSGQGFDAWLASLSGEQRAALQTATADSVQASLRRFYATGASSVFDYLVGRDEEIQTALRSLRDQRFTLEGSQGGELKWWYRVDETRPQKCWQTFTASCFYTQDFGSEAGGSFSSYRTKEPEDIIALHKWFAYGQMLMEAWVPVRVELDQLWPISGSSGYRPVSVLDDALNDYLYARTGLEAQVLRGGVAQDPLAGSLDALRAATSTTTPEEWNFVVGRALLAGPARISSAAGAYRLDALRGARPTGAEWASVLASTTSAEGVDGYFKGQFAAKFVATVL